MKRQFMVLFVSRGFASALQAVLFALLARTVSPTVFGLVAAATGIVGVVLVVTGAGMAGVISRAHARGDDAVVASAIRLTERSGVVTGAAMVLASAAWSLADARVPWGIGLVAIGLTIERTTDAALNVPIADGEVTRSAWPIVVRRALAIALLVAGLSLHLDAMWSYAVAMVVGAAVGQWLTLHQVRPAAPATTGLRALVTQGSPYMWNTLAAQSRMLDTTIVAAVLTPATAAVYAAASKLVQPALLIPQTIASLVLPRAARLDPAGSRRLVRRLLVACLLSLALVVPLALAARPLLVLVMGHQYAASAGTFRWLLAGMPFAALSAPLAAVLQGQGRARQAATNSVAYAVVLLAAVLVGALVDGTAGAAIGLSVSFVARSVALLLATRRSGTALDTAVAQTT